MKYKIILTIILMQIYYLNLQGQSFSKSDYSPYKNILVKEKITSNGDTINSCYVVIEDVIISSLKSLNAFYVIKVYKDSLTYKKNKMYFLNNVKEIKSDFIQFDANFNQGDLFYKVSAEYVNYLLNKNKNWKRENLIIIN